MGEKNEFGTVSMNSFFYIFTENEKPASLVTSMIDYNMPITMAYMKHMKLQLLSSHQDEVPYYFQNEIKCCLFMIGMLGYDIMLPMLG